MRETIRFVQLLGQALATMSLYIDTHPARVTVLAQAHDALLRTLAADGPLRLVFLDGQIAAGSRLLEGLPRWEMGVRLARVGVQRLEVDAAPSPRTDDLAALLAELRLRLDAPAPHRGPWTHHGIRVGPVALAAPQPTTSPPARVAPPPAPAAQQGRVLDHALDAETATVDWLQASTVTAGRVPIAAAEAVVHALTATVLADRDVLPPLLALRSFDEYLTIHSCNVAMLAIGLAERLGLATREVRAIGVAALLHDFGKVRLPVEILRKAGRLTDAERALVRTHPVEGARLLAQRDDDWLAATVAYEHHMHWHGRGGYPRPANPRPTHYASRIVQLCDMYDALCTDRPYRAGVPPQEALALLRAAAGTEVDPGLHAVFDGLIRHSLRLGPDLDPVARQPADTAGIAGTAA